MGNDTVKNLVAARGRRTSATILGWMEKHVYEYLPSELQSEVRRTILDNVNDLSDLAIDIVKSDADQINEYWISELDKIHRSIKSLRGIKA